ncbi:MAG: Dihydrolipoyllysine-residue succinyltransferase component of 2-oxoglutarate dehydrogenase complex [Myxococcota bacterium]|nr:Dihydrolipoyllysine-residue succinyltransferase component of 2-oxoglutarate dehydrogenase complex [Myxococcota bacterium]
MVNGMSAIILPKPDRLSPLARRVLRARGQTAPPVKGSGFLGRVTLADLEGRAAPPPAPPAPSAAASAVSAAPSARAAPPLPAAVKPREPLTMLGSPVPPEEAAACGPDAEVRRMPPMRKTIAANMIESKRTSAHVNSFWEADMERIARHRDAAKDRFKERQGTSLTFLAYIARAVAWSLARHPYVNCSVSGTDIVFHKHVNLGIAVALDQGLIVPVIRRAEELNTTGLARAIADLAARARNRKLQPQDVQGGTFTITNIGSFGNSTGMPIINQPQTAILAAGAIRKQLVALNDSDVAIHHVLKMSLSFDHRVIDGSAADLFLGDVKKFLEGWNEGL